MEEWKEYKLGDIATIKGGKRLPKGINLISKPNSHPYIRISDIGNKKVIEINDSFEYVDDETQKSISNYIVNKGNIIISIVGTIGIVSFVGKTLDNANLTENCVKLIDIKDLDSEYLYYYLISDFGKHEIKKNIVGAVQPKLPIKNIKNIRIFAPNIESQIKISSLLKSLDDKIENNRKINENLEAQAQALFKSWFVDFEPFRDQPFVDSELGPIPQGWRVGKLNDIAVVTMGTSPSGTSYNIEGIGDVFYQGRAEFGFRFPNRNKYTTEAKRFAEPNSVLLSVRAPVGDINVAEERCCIGRGLASVNSKDGKNSFLLYLMLSLKKHFEQYNAEGTVFGCINKDSLNNMPILLPNESIISAFESIASSFDNQIRTSEIEIKNLANLRDTLLPKLMSGEIKV